MTLARACWLIFLVGCSSPPSGQVLNDLLAHASGCSGIPTRITNSQTAQQEAQPVVDCMNDALTAKTVAYTSTGTSTRYGCDDTWWFVTDDGRVRMFHTDYTGDLCEGGDVIEDAGCEGPFVVDATSRAFWAVQATGCVLVVPAEATG